MALPLCVCERNQDGTPLFSSPPPSLEVLMKSDDIFVQKLNDYSCCCMQAIALVGGEPYHCLKPYWFFIHIIVYQKKNHTQYL